MRNYFSYWSNLAMMTVEAQSVIGLRMMKMAAGGPSANAEAMRMVTEKIQASQRAAFETMTGASPQKVLNGVHSKVRANRKRLSRSK